ncbi:hypothetical protein OSL60_26140, partial [Escherichia coli]|nr:hypothetical protein [Escherichia coli]
FKKEAKPFQSRQFDGNFVPVSGWRGHVRTAVVYAVAVFKADGGNIHISSALLGESAHAGQL